MILNLAFGGFFMGRRLDEGDLTPTNISNLERMVNAARGLIIEMTTLAESGHPGGALGRAEMDMLIYYGAKIDPDNPFKLGSDIIIDSAGHYSAGTYATLALLGYFSEKDAASHFRQVSSRYEGHVTSKVPGIWFDTGILGQGLSAAIGFSLANNLLGYGDVHITVKMGDGEQDKGQITEAARFAAKYGLKNITAVVDCNGQQLSGPTEEIMPINIKAMYQSTGWKTIEVDGHDLAACWDALRQAKQDGLTAIITRTTMGKGYQPIEGDHNYHGKTLPEEEAIEALKGLGLENRFEELKKLRAQKLPTNYVGKLRFKPLINGGEPIQYTKDDKIDCRGAWGNALLSIGKANLQEDGKAREGYSPIAIVDCDLKASVKTEEFARGFPSNLFQAGIMEHHAASMAGAMSLMPVLTFLADFGVLSVTEMNQQNRLTAINDGNLKLISTHCGLDVGEDGKTHQALDYLALAHHPGWQTFTPADPNQTDRMTRYMVTNYGCMHMAMGRSKVPVITKQESDKLFFDGSYEFTPGKVDVLRDYGSQAVVYTYGSMAHRAVKAAEELNKEGIGVKVLNLTTPTSPDKKSVRGAITEQTQLVITYEDHYIGGEEYDENCGMAPIVKSLLYGNKIQPKFRCMGVRDYGQSGKPDELYRKESLHEDNLRQIVLECIRKN